MARRAVRTRLRFAALVIILSAALSFSAGRANAADGFFCVGPDYLAYELDGGGHIPYAHPGLYVVRLGGTDGFSEPIVYEDFVGDVRAMRCLADNVQLLRNEWISTIDLNGPRPYRNLPMKRQPLANPGDRPDGFVLLNLGQLSHIRGATWPENVALPGTSRFTYALEVIKRPLTRPRTPPFYYSCDPESVTRLNQFDLNHNLVRSVELIVGCDLSDSVGAPYESKLPRATVACPPEPGKTTRQIVGEVESNKGFAQTFGRFQFVVEPDEPGNWRFGVKEVGRREDLSLLSNPPHGPQTTDIYAVFFRSASNTGPAPDWESQLDREIIFSPEVGRSIHYDLDKPENFALVKAFGHGRFTMLDFRMNPAQLGEKPAFEWMRFSVCVAWKAE